MVGVTDYMDNDVAVYLDLDNLVIGTAEVNLSFDIGLVLDHIQELTKGRIVLRRAYGDWRQRANMTKDLAAHGFELQSTVRLGSNNKNLADMQMVVDAMSTLVDDRHFSTYVIITGDRDFTPLVQHLRKRGKQVIGAGVKHTTSRRLADLCDHYIYYDQLAASAGQTAVDESTDLLQRALDQLLQDSDRVPASLVKQRIQSLSKGAFSRTPQGKASFRKFLSQHPDLVRMQQEDTTLYVTQPGDAPPPEKVVSQVKALLPEDQVREVLEKSLDQLLLGNGQVRASLLKQRMQELSNGAFDETLQGDKNFRKFLDRHRALVTVEQEGSTLYVRRADEVADLPAAGQRILSAAEAEAFLQEALDELLVNQVHVRASVVKQRMQELSGGVFDESQQGDSSFRAFLERYPALVQIQQKGTTLLVQSPKEAVKPAELHLFYRSALKKRGLRIVPSEIRLLLLKDIVDILQRKDAILWRELVDRLADFYQRTGKTGVSKSYINDVMRIARRAQVIDVQNGGSLAKAPVHLQLSGKRIFQDAVIQCDITYLREIKNLDEPFDLEEAARALYESTGHARYLKVILQRFSGNGSPV